MTADGGARRHGGGRRRRRFVGMAAVVVVAAWLAGRGLMLVGREPTPAADASPDGAAAAATAAPTLPAASAAPAATPAAEVAATGTADEAPAAASEPAASVSSAAANPGIEADRFAALRSAVAVHVDRAEFTAAAAALAHLRSLPLTLDQQSATAREESVLQQAVVRQLAAVEQALVGGRGGAAAAAFAPVAELAAAPSDWLHDRLAACGLASWRSGRPRPDSGLPSPRPLPRGRMVRATHGDGEVRGVVVAADAGECTLRVEVAGAIAFPSVALKACEPDDPTAEEAVELALAAARQDDVLLARAWAAVAARRGGAELPRLQYVLSALP